MNNHENHNIAGYEISELWIAFSDLKAEVFVLFQMVTGLREMAENAESMGSLANEHWETWQRESYAIETDLDALTERVAALEDRGDD